MQARPNESYQRLPLGVLLTMYFPVFIRNQKPIWCRAISIYTFIKCNLRYFELRYNITQRGDSLFLVVDSGILL